LTINHNVNKLDKIVVQILMQQSSGITW